MSFANRFNKGKKFDFNTEGLEFTSLADLYNGNGEDKVYTLKAIFINTKSKFGDTPVFASDSFLVNAPSHLLDTVKEILADADAVASINDNKVGFTIYPYKSEKFNVDTFGIKFVDLK